MPFSRKSGAATLPEISGDEALAQTLEFIKNLRALGYEVVIASGGTPSTNSKYDTQEAGIIATLRENGVEFEDEADSVFTLTSVQALETSGFRDTFNFQVASTSRPGAFNLDKAEVMKYIVASRQLQQDQLLLVDDKDMFIDQASQAGYPTLKVAMDPDKGEPQPWFYNYAQTIIELNAYIADRSAGPRYKHTLFGVPLGKPFGAKPRDVKVAAARAELAHLMDPENHAAPNSSGEVKCLNKGALGEACSAVTIGAGAGR